MLRPLHGMDAPLLSPYSHFSGSCTDLLSVTMNKFLKKKSDGPAVNDDALHALSQPPSPVMKKSSNSRWKKTPKRQPERKPQLDLSVALPSTDDFRTSLIMPSLSTRFSMLREQDDPSSLLGKASDDSVLQPRRKSRMVDFGFGNTGLSDIAEVSSINGSVRPPFAQNDRQHSYISEEGYGSEADATPSSMMSRSRPGEGNVLFGGRQKVYKIPTSGAHSTRSLGKVYYEDDVGMSAFQKYRMKEREVDESQFPRASDESQGFDFGLDQAEPGAQDEDALDTLPNDSAKDLSHSPSLSSYDKKRSTTSSTARSDARSSTAATSIASQPAATSAQPSPAQAPVSNTIVTNVTNTSIPAAPMSAPFLDRSNTKTRRLYEQGLDQHMHEQQNSTVSRLNSIQRQRALSGKKSPPLLHNVKSAGNLHDRNPQPVYALRPQSPPLISPPAASFGSIRLNSNCSSPALSGPHSPIDTPFDENRVLTQALEPADRGKATAMGAFNKPAHAFDEQQYLERQKALQRSASTAALKNKPHPQLPTQHHANRFEFEPEQHEVPEIPALDRPDARKEHEPTRAYNVFQNAANALPAQVPAQPSPASSKSPLPDTHRTFFGNISASEDEDEDDDLAQSFNQPEYGYGAYHNKWQPTPLQPVSEHPAMRSEKSRSTLAEEEEVDEMEVKPLNTQPSSRSLRNDLTVNITPKVPQDVDSPTLGPQAQALNGMVHHLRQRSNQSSLYPQDDFALPEGDVPDVPGMPWNSNKSISHAFNGNTLDTHSARESSYATSNPWDLDEQSFVGEPRASRMTVSPIDEPNGTRFPSNRASEISLVQDGVPNRPPLNREASEISLVQEQDFPSWQQELRKQHTRDASTATQQERDAFANELAARRRLIQERIQTRSVVERDAHSRGTSPAGAPVGPMRAFGMLRSKTSRESFVNAQEQPPKAQKILGVANGFPTERNGYSPDVGRPRGTSSPRPPLPNAQHPAFKHDGPGPSRAMDMDPQQAERALASAGRSPASSAARSRSRSNSAATTGRSRSRTGPYRDDLEKAMVEGHGSSAAAHTPDMSPFPGASPEVMNSFGRDSEENKQTLSNYFDHRNAQGTRLAHNGPSPVTLTPNVYTPGRPAPVANPYSQNTTPPLTGSSPSITQADFTQIMQSNARASGPGLRKKTISKSDISEPVQLLSSTSNVDTVPLPAGASLKNGMDEPPPIPPINPRRRATRKLFGRNRSESTSDGSEVKASASDPALNTSPKRDYHFPPSNVVRMPAMYDYEKSPAIPQQGFNPSASPERVPPRSANGPQRAATAPMDGGMF